MERGDVNFMDWSKYVTWVNDTTNANNNAYYFNGGCGARFKAQTTNVHIGDGIDALRNCVRNYEENVVADVTDSYKELSSERVE